MDDSTGDRLLSAELMLVRHKALGMQPGSTARPHRVTFAHEFPYLDTRLAIKKRRNHTEDQDENPVEHDLLDHDRT